MIPHSSNSLKLTKARFYCLASCFAIVVFPERGGPQMTAINWITNEINNYDGGHRFQLVWDKKRSLLLK